MGILKKGFLFEHKMGSLCCKKRKNSDEEDSIEYSYIKIVPPIEVKTEIPEASAETQLEESEEFFLDCDSVESLKREIKDANKSGLAIAIVEFYNIQACNMSAEIRPELEKMAKEFSDKRALVLFMRIDGKQPGVGWTYNLRGFPTYIIFRNGKEVERMIGPQVDAEFIRNKVEKQ